MTEFSDEILAERAKAGDEPAFAALMARHENSARAYFYRMTAHREDAQDLSQELWARVFQKLPSFESRSSFRTWLFTLASRMAIDHHRAKIRFSENAQDLAKEIAISGPEVGEAFEQVTRDNPHERYELREHIDFCLTCILKTLTLEQQIAVLLCDVHGFSNAEAAEMLGRSLPAIKHWLHDARATMNRIFEHRCALISKTGICHQCSELNGVFNPQQDQQAEVARIDLVQAANDNRRNELLDIRLKLAREIDPLNSSGPQIQETIMDVVRRATVPAS